MSRGGKWLKNSPYDHISEVIAACEGNQHFYCANGTSKYSFNIIENPDYNPRESYPTSSKLAGLVQQLKNAEQHETHYMSLEDARELATAE